MNIKIHPTVGEFLTVAVGAYYCVKFAFESDTQKTKRRQEEKMRQEAREREWRKNLNNFKSL